jgi:translation initiation factor 1
VKKRGGLVYSTDKGRMCPRCGWPADRCACSRTLQDPAAGPPAGDGVVRVSRQTKGRKGKGVTVITGVPLPVDEMAALARELKKRCGSGGTVRDGAIEIQGDHRDVLVSLLQARGWTVKRAGG